MGLGAPGRRCKPDHIGVVALVSAPPTPTIVSRIRSRLEGHLIRKFTNFRFPDEMSNSITVSMDDTLRVVCPAPGVEKRYLKIHKVSALSYESCLLETQRTLIATCDGSEASQKPTIIGVRRFSPLPSSKSILFEPGETYYWIGA
ncbi:hypothetical protein TELCIR_13512 [Teladorsagia circumcincta]|uniref:Ephrin RBD domain-containing protein n=1 Tax=Teladorsagia circumcincta TaxID=45464 RepID=A0A2G9U3I8_TELCI|nr:hypothetical protein TELCIR_13512 [Teladorsagia circumcincta]